MLSSDELTLGDERDVMSDNKYTTDELEFLDKAMLSAMSGLLADPNLSNGIAAMARCNAEALLVERRKLRGTAIVLDEESIARAARLDALHCVRTRINIMQGVVDGDAVLLKGHDVLAVIDDEIDSLESVKP